MKSLIASSVLFLVPFYTLGSTLDFQLRLEAFSETETIPANQWIEAGCDSHWVGEGVCLIEKVLDEGELPFEMELGDSYLLISKDGNVSLGASYGDMDSSVSGTLQLPVGEGGEILPLTAPLQLEVSGGDHASGAWSFSGTLKIMVE